MITLPDGTIARNLQEQVAKNQSDLEDLHDLNLLGIKVVGEIESSSDLPDPLTYSGEFGDTYAVGSSSPYDYYAFTRANTVIVTPHWFEIGTFPQAGPTGATGPQGEVGSQIYSGTDFPETVRTGDYFLNTVTSNLYKYTSSGWELVTYLKGEQGIQGLQGIQGIQGPVGNPINMVGVVNSTSLLPTDPWPSSKATAYLVGTASPYTIYVITGASETDTSTWSWQPLGIGGSNVTESGNPVGTFDADTKVDKIISTSTYDRAYVVGAGGTQTTTIISSSAIPSSLVKRDSNGDVLVPTTPTSSSGAVSKSYADTALANKVSIKDNSTIYTQVYARDTNNAETSLPVSSGNDVSTIAMRNSDGNVYTSTPTADLHAANKSYADSLVSHRYDVFDLFVLGTGNTIPNTYGDNTLNNSLVTTSVYNGDNYFMGYRYKISSSNTYIHSRMPAVWNTTSSAIKVKIVAFGVTRNSALGSVRYYVGATGLAPTNIAIDNYTSVFTLPSSSAAFCESSVITIGASEKLSLGIYWKATSTSSSSYVDLAYLKIIRVA